MKKTTKVTALLPAYQAGGFIQATLDSLSAQAHPDFSVIVSIDQCDDDTHLICMRHAERDARFRVVRQDKRLGYVGNCNFLLGQADAEYVLFAFHDDILLPEYVGKLSAALDARPEAVMSYSDVLLTDVDGKQEQWVFTALDGLQDPVQRGLKMLDRVDNWWVPNRGLFRLARARRIHGLKTHGAGGFSADWPWLFHMSLLGEFVRVPETLCHKFYKPESLSRNWRFSTREWYEVSASCMREIWNSELPVKDKLSLAVPLTNWLIKTRQQAVQGRQEND
jgi:glycosyltransferase involved in cell wall biosynthesis